MMRIQSSLLAAMLAPLALSACAGSAAAPLTPIRSSAPAATAVEASTALRGRADDLVKLINGEAHPATMFAPAALAKVPAERLSAIARAVRTKYGAALAIDRIEARTENSGLVFITFEKTLLSVRLGVQPAAPNLINELLFV